MLTGRGLKFAGFGRHFDFVSGAFTGLSEIAMDGGAFLWYHYDREKACSLNLIYYTKEQHMKC